LDGVAANIDLAVEDNRYELYLRRAHARLKEEPQQKVRERLYEAATALHPGRADLIRPPADNPPVAGVEEQVVPSDPPGPTTVPARIEAEGYDAGGEGVGFHDVGPEQTGSYTRIYRQGGVDIDLCEDDGGGLSIGGIRPQEWLAYTVEASHAGLYDLDLRLATQRVGGSIRVEIDGKDATGAIAIPNTGGWQRWQTITKPDVRLGAGRHRLKVVFDHSEDDEFVCNFNWFELRKRAGARHEETRPAATETPRP
jgi:hypothetical protein